MLKKVLSLFLAITLLCCAVPFAAVAQDLRGLSVTDNGVYTTTVFSELPLCVEAQIKLTSAQGTRTGMLFSNWYYKCYTFYELAVNENGQPYVYWQKNSNTSAEKLTFTDVSVETGEWMTLKVVADFSKSEVHCYINGELKQTLTTTLTEAFPLESAFSVGNNLRQGHGYNWRGEMASLTVTGTSGVLAAYDLRGKTEGDTLIDSVGGHTAVWEQLWFNERQPVGDYDFSIALVGDTQTLSKNNSSALPKMYNYIRDTAEEKNLQCVFTLGDLTDTGAGKTSEWVAITNAMNVLNGVVTHNMMRGNHDHTDWYDQYITVETYGDGVVTYDGTMKNYYREMEMGGVDYLMVVLEYHPATAIQNWAAQVIENHPDHRVIISTHEFTNERGTYSSMGEVGDSADLFHNVVKKFPNVVLVLSGHWSSQDVVVGQSKGEHGNVITHVLVDPQEVDQPIINGAGLVAYLYFSNDGKDIEVEYYSPSRDQYYKMSNQFTFHLDLPWDDSVPALNASTAGAVNETAFTFTPAGLSPYSGGKYTATNTNYYKFPETETAIVQAVQSKFNLYYDREGAVYKTRDLFTNGDTDGETRWTLLTNEYFQRTVAKSGGSQLFRKIDSFVPLNSLGQEITGSDFKTTFRARLEDENKGLVLFGFRQQVPGKYTAGYYKLQRTQAFVAIGRKGLTVASGADIVYKNGGDATNDMYNHLSIAFDNVLPKNIAVTVEVHGALCDVAIYAPSDMTTPLYAYNDLAVPFTTEGSFAYSVSDQNNSIGAISLEVYDEDGNVTDLATPSAQDDPSVLRFYGGDIRVDAKESADGYVYTLTAEAVDGYRLVAEDLTAEDANGKALPVTRIGTNTFTVVSANGGTVTARFEKGENAPLLQAEKADSVETYTFSAANLSPYVNGKYTAVDKQYYTFPETETGIVEALESKFHFYYDREGAVYAQRDLFTNNDTVESRWILLYNYYLQRTTSKTSGEIFRKVDSLVPLNSLGEEISLQNFETTFDVRFESATHGAVILGFRQQTPGHFTTGWYKLVQNQAFVAIGRSGITVAGGSDIKYQRNGDASTDMYNHFETSFEETLPQDVRVKIRAVGTSVKVWIYPSGETQAVYYEETEVPYTTAGTLAYAVSTVKHDIGNIQLTKLDANGNTADMLTNVAKTAYDLTYRGGTISYEVEQTDDTFTYTLDVQPNEGYALLAGSLYVTDTNGNAIVPTRVGFRETTDGTQYTFTCSTEGTLSATFVQPTTQTPNIGNVGTSVNETLAGVRFVSRVAVFTEAGDTYMWLGGEKCKVTDFGMLIGLAANIGDNTLDFALADSHAYVKRLSVKQSEIYYDVWDTGVDMSVCITDVDKVKGGADMEITARAYVTVMIGDTETTLYANPFTSTFNSNI